MKDLHSTMDLTDRQRRKAIMKAIARNPRASPFIALLSIGTARGLFADLDAFSGDTVLVATIPPNGICLTTFSKLSTQLLTTEDIFSSSSGNAFVSFTNEER